MMFTAESTRAQMREWLTRTVIREGKMADCPCCGQNVKVYHRKINSTQARALVLMYRAVGSDWGHLPTLRMALAPHHSNEEPKLRYWGLLEEETAVREDGGRAGWWRITPAGVEWVMGRTRVPKYALIYNGACIGMDASETVSVIDALGDKFSYAELMAVAPL